MGNILVVEDEFDLAKTLRKRLTSNGYEVRVAEDAYQGVQAIREEAPDLVILDLMLPCGGGMFVLNSLKSKPLTKFIPVIVMTGMNDDDYKKKIMDLGVDAYMEKPYDPPTLLKTISSLLE